MKAFIMRFLGIIFGYSIYIDLTYGGASWGTVVVGVLLVIAIIHWAMSISTVNKKESYEES